MDWKQKCDSCKRIKLVDFIASDRIWRQVTGGDKYSGGVFCLHCFVNKANENDITIEKDDLLEVYIYNPVTENELFSLRIK